MVCALLDNESSPMCCGMIKHYDSGCQASEQFKALSSVSTFLELILAMNYVLILYIRQCLFSKAIIFQQYFTSVVKENILRYRDMGLGIQLALGSFFSSGGGGRYRDIVTYSIWLNFYCNHSYCTSLKPIKSCTFPHVCWSRVLLLC